MPVSMTKRSKISVVPLTVPRANAFVKSVHRHHAPIPGGFAWFCVGAVADCKLVGVAIAGRPTNRNNDDGQTVEVLRVATDGTPNACSALLGSCARAAQAIGAYRILTYTLTEEGGYSLRGAGWICECEDTGKSWWTHAGTRAPAIARDHMSVHKSRWGKKFSVPITYEVPSEQQTTEQAQTDLFATASTPCRTSPPSQMSPDRVIDALPRERLDPLARPASSQQDPEVLGHGRPHRPREH